MTARHWLSHWRALLSGARRLLPPRWQSPEIILRFRRIPDDLWGATLDLYPFLRWRDEAGQQRLRELATVFLARHEFVPAGGLALSDNIAVAIAAQACLPILARGLSAYAGLGDIVVHPGQVLAHRQVVDDTGVVHLYDEVLAGEAMQGGPIMLSWQDVQHAQDISLGYNVVVHEFVHALDMSDGVVDGVPPLPGHISRETWEETLWQAFDHHSEALAHGQETWLDPYALQDGLVEFFPVIAETFFVRPHHLQADHPALYGLLSAYFEDDPAKRAGLQEPGA